ncbi:hypothetical protein [Candidatus Neptunichlamydia sp. REUL1]|uniref:hypothetical protein n=1 Tax=Candidatus Neptunichlamydia sp. REUL1 TaxID=3064277 RepID=UPI00292FB152|nr:hypothetical protein [Candidatus Neptunochlamydia sp. REUL1]
MSVSMQNMPKLPEEYSFSMPSQSPEKTVLIDQSVGGLRVSIQTSSGTEQQIPRYMLQGLPKVDKVPQEFFMQCHATVSDHSVRFNGRLLGGTLPGLQTIQNWVDDYVSANRIDGFERIVLHGTTREYRNMADKHLLNFSDLREKFSHRISTPSDRSEVRKRVYSLAEDVRTDLKKLGVFHAHLSLQIKQALENHHIDLWQAEVYSHISNLNNEAKHKTTEESGVDYSY